MSYQQVADGQVNPEIPINENMEALGGAFLFAHDVTADTGLDVGFTGGTLDGAVIADATITATDNATNYVVAHRSTGALTTATDTTNWANTTTYGRVARAVFASGELTFYDERHSVGGIFDHNAGSGATAAQAANKIYAGPASGADATPTFRSMVAADMPAQPFDVGAFYPGVPGAAAVMLRVPVARAIQLPANLAGSYGKASAASTGTVAFDITKNGTTIATATFTAAAIATFTTVAGAAQSLAAGDVLAITCPATADATLADIGFVLAGTR